jgi:hypothetical protein
LEEPTAEDAFAPDAPSEDGADENDADAEGDEDSSENVSDELLEQGGSGGSEDESDLGSLMDDDL